MGLMYTVTLPTTPSRSCSLKTSSDYQNMNLLQSAVGLVLHVCFTYQTFYEDLFLNNKHVV